MSRIMRNELEKYSSFSINLEDNNEWTHLCMDTSLYYCQHIILHITTNALWQRPHYGQTAQATAPNEASRANQD